MREQYIDISKGIGILLVVLGHITGPWQELIYGFHMPFFFILSGYCFSTKYFFAPFNYVITRAKRLLLPYILINIFAFFFFPHEEVSWFRMFGIIKAIDYEFNLLGATWFLKALFVVSVVSFIILLINCKLYGNKKGGIISCIISLCITIFSDFVFGTRISSWFFQSFFFILGFVWKNNENIINSLIIKQSGTSISVVLYKCGGVALYVICVYLRKGDICTCSYQYLCPFLISSILGSVWIVSVSKAISKGTSKLKDYLVFLGANTMPIILFHWIGFRLFDIIIGLSPTEIENVFIYDLGKFTFSIWFSMSIKYIFEKLKQINISVN